MSTFSSRLKELRQEYSLTQKELAERLNYTQSNVSEWEKGTVEPKASALASIAQIFNVSTDFLIGREDDFGQVTVQSPTPALSEEEQKLIQDYRGLARPLKDLLQGMIKTWQQNTLSENATYQKRG